MKEEQFATLDDTILYIWKNTKHLNLNDINRMIQELKEVLEKDENKEEKKLINELNKEYEKIPVNCQICEFFLEDDFFIEEFQTKFVCSSNDEINPVFIDFACEEFGIGKLQLVEFLERLSGEKSE